MSVVELFGGAITVPLKNGFSNVSEFRQVPDNQEVFVCDTQSLIFELLEQVEQSNEEIAKYHFQQLAADNEALESAVAFVEKQPANSTPQLLSYDTEIYILQGTQKIAKFNEKNAFNTIEIILAVVRLVKFSTDMVISINLPIQLDPTSSEQKYVQQQQTEQISIDAVKREIMSIINGLNIIDEGLFGV